MEGEEAAAAEAAAAEAAATSLSRSADFSTLTFRGEEVAQEAAAAAAVGAETGLLLARALTAVRGHRYRSVATTGTCAEMAGMVRGAAPSEDKGTALCHDVECGRWRDTVPSFFFQQYSNSK